MTRRVDTEDIGIPRVSKMPDWHFVYVCVCVSVCVCILGKDRIC